MVKYFIILILISFCISCSDSESFSTSDGFNEEFRLEDEIKQLAFIERLKVSGLEFIIADNGSVRYYKKDSNKLQNIAFESEQNLYTAETRGWKVSAERAKQVVLDKYPNILQRANMIGPSPSTVHSDIGDFVRSGTRLWHVRIHCNSGGAHALFFVHPESGLLYIIQAPEAADSAECA